MKNRIVCIAAAAALLAALTFGGCKNNTNPDPGDPDGEYRGTFASVKDHPGLYMYSRNGYAFSTGGTLALYAPFETEEEREAAMSLGDEVDKLLAELESTLSVSVEGSDIYKFNTAYPGDRVEITEHTYNVLQYALDVYEETDGAYNAGVYYSVDLYGFAPRADGETRPYDRESPATELPAEKYVSAFKELATAFGDLKLEQNDGKYYAIKPQKTVTVEGDSTVYSLSIDLGGIGKGYACDLIDEMVDEAGYEYGYYNLGSSSWQINGSAVSEDGKWNLTSRDPRGGILGGSYISRRAANTAVSTSGDYEQYYTVDDVRYCHIINPATGSPIQTGIMTASLNGGTAAEADARTTAICCMGLERAVEYMNSEEVKAEGLAITFAYAAADGKYYVITNRPQEVNILSQNYTPGNTVDADGNVVLMADLQQG